MEDSAEPGATHVRRWGLWRDRLALALIAMSGLSTLALAGYLAVIARRPLTLPFGAGVIWFVNTLGGVWLHRRPADRAGAYLLFGATALVQVFVWVAAIGLVGTGR